MILQPQMTEISWTGSGEMCPKSSARLENRYQVIGLAAVFSKDRLNSCSRFGHRLPLVFIRVLYAIAYTVLLFFPNIPSFWLATTKPMQELNPSTPHTMYRIVLYMSRKFCVKGA
jgi:hypothetical protein